ncbi:MAG: hypothetical protein WA110_02370 [Anaerolineaceae bacterium]
MSITDQLSSRINQHSDQANIDLAEQIANEGNMKAVSELAEGLEAKDAALQSDCVKTLYEIGKRRPELIAPYASLFLKLLRSRNNRMVWGGMMALETIAEIQADQIFPEAGFIQKTIQKGSTITRDAGIGTMAGVARARAEYNRALMPFLLEHVRTCRPASVPQHAEKVFTAINSDTAPDFLSILRQRLPDLTPSQTKRVQKMIKTLEKDSH